MNQEYCEIDGQVVSIDDLRISRAKDFANAVNVALYAHLIECRRTNSNDEIIVFNAEVEIGQKTVYDIKSIERIAVEFDVSDNSMPEVLALRRNFPSVPHINLRLREFPRSLCVTELSYSELKLRWTGTTFVEDIRRWLAEAAKGNLHAEDQPLEPLLWGSEDVIILPHDLFTKYGPSEPLFIPIVRKVNERRILIAERPEFIDKDQNPLEYVATVFKTDCLTHGIISKAPADLYELHQFLEHGNLDLLKELRQHLDNWRNKTRSDEILAAKLILIVALPKARQENALQENTEWKAFLVLKSIREIAAEIAPAVKSAGYNIPLIGQGGKGDDVSIHMLNPVFSLSRESAAQLNGFSSRDERKITAVGLGALGSQVLMNLVRAGYGKWTLIDEDVLLPHNLARHALDGFSIGGPKVYGLAVSANKTVDEEPIADYIVTDVLNPSESQETIEKLENAFTNADIILDASASVPVARYLVHNVDSSARRISIFLNPDGTDVVILAEDEKRKITLDFLEMQYYRYLINETCLADHLKRKHGRIRVATSCRDVSATIPQDYVALQAAICSRTIHKLTSNQQAFVSIWRIDEDQINVQSYTILVRNSIKCKIGNWILCTDEGFIDKVHEARANKLPNETGGVLVGSYDMQRKIVYVVDCLLSPPDSEEWPTHYIRGCQGLRSQVEKIQEITENQLEYVGEWHSHPPNCSVKPSPDDRKVFKWISDHMIVDGLPPLMLIVSDPGKYEFYLKELDLSSENEGSYTCVGEQSDERTY